MPEIPYAWPWLSIVLWVWILGIIPSLPFWYKVGSNLQKEREQPYDLWKKSTMAFVAVGWPVPWFLFLFSAAVRDSEPMTILHLFGAAWGIKTSTRSLVAQGILIL